MSIDRRVRKLSKLFEPLGKIPLAYGELGGKPLFQYKRANELRILYRKKGEDGTDWVKTDAGLYMPLKDYELGYQAPDPRDNYWLIAKWLEPGDEATWNEKYKHVGFPALGYFTCFQPFKDIQTPDGRIAAFTPTEEHTAFLVDHIKYQMEMKPAEHWEQIVKHYERKDRQMEITIQDMLDDALHMSVPGKRGGLVSYPQTKHTR